MPSRLFIASSILLILAAACSGESETADPTVTASSQVPGTDSGTPGAASSPAVSLTPRPDLAPDIARARLLESEGNIEEAAEVYIVAASQPATRIAGTLGAARLLLELDEPAEVRILLEPFVNGASGEALAAHYMLARAYTALGMPAEALAQYDLYIQSGRPAVPYAYLDRSRNLLELDRPQEAAASAQQGLGLGVPGSARGPFRTMIAQSHERAGSVTEALTAYNEVIQNDGAFALARIASIKRELGDPTAADDLTRLLAEYPSSGTALEEMKAAFDRGESFPDGLVGLVYYRHNEYTIAEPYFRDQIALAPAALETAEAYYYLGAILESRGEMDAALASYELVTTTNPNSPLADDALWWRGRIAQDAGRLGDAQALYERIVDEYPDSSWANDALFRSSMIHYVNYNYEEAAEYWRLGVSSATDTLQQERFRFWQAKSLLMNGDDAAGKAILQDMATSGEDDFYGIRALDLLNGRHDQPVHDRESSINLSPAFDWAAAEAWLTQKTGRPVSEGTWTADQRWQRAEELWLVGRTGQGDSEAFDLMESYASDPIAMYTISRRLQSLGRIGLSGRAGQRLMRTLDTNPNQGLPKPLLSLAYPPAFGPLADQYSNDEDLSPLLLLAFVRQESFFDPRAISPVGALGLTQVLPGTGTSIATRLGVADFDADHLLHADLNLRFGAHYMAQQLEEFDNEIFVALAAYNAGPGAAARWRAAANADDADIYLETVEFAETRLYIEIVAENYAIYRYLYGGESRPTLP